MTAVHKDKLDQPIGEGDCVVYVDNNKLAIGTIIKMSPRMIKVAEVGSRGYWSRGILRNPSEVVKIQSEELTVYLLKNTQ